ncbi:nitric oxide synthase 1-like [Diadema setosum]|uniref:nitric oxide synthase 1-like n=1 Tax=Diadema setosum TaxID=31175 RepID=UPI003B3A41C3
MIDGSRIHDTLHQKSLFPSQNGPCTEQRCMGSIVFPPRKKDRTKEEVLLHAEDFINQFYVHNKRSGSKLHKERLAAVFGSIEKTGTYELTEAELTFGAKTAWRNAARCIGRIQWNHLKVFDARKAISSSDMFDALCSHLSYATNKGNIRSAITIFPHRKGHRGDFRVWNSQLISYAGYKQKDGSIVGDPAGVEFTQVCEKLGWKGKGGPFEVLPLVLQADGGEPEMFDIPSDLLLQVPLEHPKYPLFKELGLKWYAVPAVSNMLLDLGGLEFTACPFNGWYMGTEIGARDLCDKNRLNMLEKVGRSMGLDTSTNSTLWKDQALVETNVAVLHSFQKMNVTIIDHHSASESFMKHMENEQRLRGGCPADWVWIVPPMSGGITPVFHQEMLNYELKPSFEYQVCAARNVLARCLRYNLSTATFKGERSAAAAVMFATRLMGKALAKRVKTTILYATETGNSERFARMLCEMFNHAFNAKVVCMENYDVENIESESLLLVVTSTFGNGDPPENGEKFGKFLFELCRDDPGSKPSCIRSIRLDEHSGPIPRVSSPSSLLQRCGKLLNVRYSVFGLGSRAYPHFCAYARKIDGVLATLGGERIALMGEGDELSGREEAFRQWAQGVFKAACEVFCVEDCLNVEAANAALNTTAFTWSPEKTRLSRGGGASLEAESVAAGLTLLHGRPVVSSLLKERRQLQAEHSSRSTICVRLDTQGAPELSYKPGDHVGIFPPNEEELVRRTLQFVTGELPHDTVVTVEFQQHVQTADGLVHRWVPAKRLPQSSLKTALTNYLDITSPPTPGFLLLLASQASDEQEARTLKLLGEGGVHYEVWKYDRSPNLPEVFEEFPSVKVNPSFLLTELPILKPRYYSISSSPKMYLGEIHATVAVIEYRVRGDSGPIHHGVCSTWLNRLSINEIVPCFIRRAPTFRMPENRALPILLAGAGTGIAPFRSFWQQRQIELYQARPEADDEGKSFGDVTLIFGCRRSKVDDLYRSEREEAVKEGAISQNFTAYSREPNQEKVYIQDIMSKHAELVYQIVCRDNGHFYVCGDVSMAADVCATLERILAEEGGMTPTEARDFIGRMKDTNHYHEDIFGVTSRAGEVQKMMRRVFRRRREISIHKGEDNGSLS